MVAAVPGVLPEKGGACFEVPSVVNNTRAEKVLDELSTVQKTQTKKEGASSQVPVEFAKTVQNTKTKKGGAVSRPFEFAKTPVVQNSHVQEESANEKLFAVRKLPLHRFPFATRSRI